MVAPAQCSLGRIMQRAVSYFQPIILAFVWALSAALSPGYAQDDSPPEQVTVLQRASDILIPEEDLIVVLIPLTAEELSELALVWQGHVRAAIEKASLTNLALQ